MTCPRLNLKKEIMIFIDFETRSACDLKKCGADVYSEDPSTEVLCLGYADGENKSEIWTPRQGTKPIHFLGELAESKSLGSASSKLLIAHNAPFEIAIWNNVCVPKYGFPPLPAHRFLCTAAMCYAMALPGSLEKASAAVGIEDGKDMVGHRLMLQLSQPKDVKDDGTIEWWEDEEKSKRLFEYCKRDIEVERELYKRIVKLSDSEYQVWLLDQKINRRGIAVDERAARAALSIVNLEKKRLDEEMRRLTGNEVATCTASAQLTRWLKRQAVEVDSVAKQRLLDLLDEDLPSHVREVIGLRLESAKTSTAKLEMMIQGLGKKGRIRGLTQYHGSSTGRFAGRRIQVQNFPRPSIYQSEIENVFEILGKVVQ